jgi:two-component system, NtrC family, sensor histidine kinase HydH
VTTHATLDLIACAGHLAVGIFVLLRETGSPLALPLGLLTFSLFSWTFSDFSYAVSGEIQWHWLDLGLSPFSPALALHVVTTFVGGLRHYRWPLIASYVFFSMMAMSAWPAFASPLAAAWLRSTAYSVTFMSGEVAAMTFAVCLLLVHVRRVTDPFERNRTNTMIAALLVGAASATSDFWDDLGVPVPSMTNIGTTIGVLLMGHASLRFRFLGGNLTRERAGIALAMAIAGLASYLGVFYWLRGNHAVLMVATVSVTLALTAALRRLGTQYMTRRDKVEGLTILGRFSAQMAHDLKNPLAALNGAIQFLMEEVDRGQSLTEQAQFLSLLHKQVGRITRVLDDYQRIGNMQLQRSLVQLNDTIRSVLALQSFAKPGVQLNAVLDDTLPLCSVDRDMVARAIENLVRNAIEAMPQGGVITVQTTALGTNTRQPDALISVRDTGTGMDARHCERAFDEFFTTKPQGSGLGLSFVRRVVKAHAGRVKIDSRIGEGTLVTRRFSAR